LTESVDLGGHKVRIFPVTRIQGRADIEVLFTPDQEVTEARFRGLEFRGFEEMLSGVPAMRAPSIVSRVCGSCGPFHQLASCIAIENATGCEVPDSALWFRELLTWLWLAFDHLLRATYMALPDFALPMSDVGVRNVAGIYMVEQETIGRLTAVQSAFADSLALLTGLPIHPSVVVPGGVSYIPDWPSFAKVGDLMEGCEHDLREVLRLVEMLTRRNTQMIDTQTPLNGFYMSSAMREHPALMGDCMIVAPFKGGEPRFIGHDEFYESMAENTVAWSYVKPVTVGDFTPLLVGPMARVNVGFDTDTPWAELEATRTHEHWGHPLDRDMLFLSAMALEVIWAWEKARLLLDQRPRVKEPCAAIDMTEAEGLAIVESPRGSLVHHLQIGSDGEIAGYRIVSPLQFNYDLLNQHLSGFAQKSISGVEIGEAAAQSLQLAVRSFGPCVSCGTH